jgi:phospho-N-acetylmuramoyl-pentapeptide-transferase
MLYNLLYPLADQFIVFNLFKYLTFRTGGAILTAMIICFATGPSFIRWLRSKKASQPIRSDGPETHFKKKGTPTMGGLMILFSVTVSTLLWVNIYNPYMWAVLWTFAGFGVIGFSDDYAKLTKSSHKGVPGRVRLILECAIAIITVLIYTILTTGAPGWASLAFPFFKNFAINLSWFFIPFGIVVIVGAANAVNLTDGLDGLAIGPIMICAASFGLIAYLVGNAKFAEYLQINYVRDAGELAVFCGALLGAGLGFLWFNAPPAQVFMGDTGSLSMGGALGAVAVVTKHEIVLAIIGGLFVIETLSVIIQVVSFKTRGKRVFKMAPLHHHFEKLGWPETQVVVRFWIISIILALIGLSTLKLR